MGVELQTKQTLKMLAGEDKADVLELLLEHPQDWSMSAHGLFHKALPTLAGRDLGDEHRELAKRVQKLFTARNRGAPRRAIAQSVGEDPRCDRRSRDSIPAQGVRSGNDGRSDLVEWTFEPLQLSQDQLDLRTQTLLASP
jgi:hypothetical protein